MKQSYFLVPKPENKKKKNKQNGYKYKADRYCYYCKTPYAERHEVYGGVNRQTSIDMKFQLDLCPECHRAWHSQNSDLWVERKAYWQAEFQRRYEEKLIRTGISNKQARDCFMHLIGKNYI